jgi:Tfp pilus assembly protein PilO
VSRRVILFAAIAAVVILLGWYLLLWSPAKSDLDKAKKRTAAAQAQEQQLQAQVRRLRDVRASEPLRRAQLETLRTAIPDTPNLGQFLVDVNDAATKSGINFMSIAPSEPKAPATAVVTPTPTTAPASGTTPTTAATTATPPAAVATPPAEVTLVIQVQGGYFQVMDFLNRLDRLPRLVVTDALNVNADPNTGALTASINARMFVRSIPAGFAGATATPSTTSTTAAGGATTTTAPGAAGATTTTAPGATTSTTGARP